MPLEAGGAIALAIRQLVGMTMGWRRPGAPSPTPADSTIRVDHL
jgi:hypothetical protein